MRASTWTAAGCIAFLMGVGVFVTATRPAPAVATPAPSKYDLICINKDTVTLVMRKQDAIWLTNSGIFASRSREPSLFHRQKEGDTCVIEKSQPNPLGEPT